MREVPHARRKSSMRRSRLRSVRVADIAVYSERFVGREVTIGRSDCPSVGLSGGSRAVHRANWKAQRAARSSRLWVALAGEFLQTLWRSLLDHWKGACFLLYNALTHFSKCNLFSFPPVDTYGDDMRYKLPAWQLWLCTHHELCRRHSSTHWEYVGQSLESWWHQHIYFSALRIMLIASHSGELVLV